ncbi:uncharacterized protein LOC126298951 [Schistocerca gregaria]|uniref:uncharacterized protein LOC126298951 n=1 Tax=Schistocerca gregaria TaxID=7010 RepID=UPI00211DC63B|nr:uncharacterized protein LOC126298951 [Schistocerca gregaria]
MVRKDSAVLEPEQALIFAKKLLCNKVFLGHYQERRYVDSLKSYRDVVLIDEGESDLKSQLDIVKQHMAIYCGPSISWIGITGPDVIGAPNGYAVWVKLHEMPFGKYWFQIKNIKISQSCEVVVSLKRVRKDKHSGNETKDELEEDNSLRSVSSILVDFFSYGTAKNLVNRITSELTTENVSKTVCFITVLLITVLAGLLHLVKLLGFFSLKFLHQLTILLQVLTPYFLGIMDFLSKCVGGLYILIAMMWRDRGVPHHSRIQTFPMPIPKQRRVKPLPLQF